MKDCTIEIKGTKCQGVIVDGACGSCRHVPGEPEESKYILWANDPFKTKTPLKVDDRALTNKRIEAHSTSSQRVTGSYPVGMSRRQVESKVNGTFGGRFESFGGGRFSYVAYTD